MIRFDHSMDVCFSIVLSHVPLRSESESECSEKALIIYNSENYNQSTLR